MRKLLNPVLVAAALSLFAGRTLATTFAVASDSALTYAMTNAKGGDRVNMATGTYTAARFSPDTSGRSYANGRIRIVGNTTTPSNVVVNGAVPITKSYLAIYGLNFKGRLTISAAKFDSVRSCVVDSGGLFVLGDDTNPDTTTTCNNHVFSAVRFNTGNAGASYSWKLRDASDCVFDSVKMTARIYTNADAGRGRYLYYSRRNTFTDCRFNLDYCSAPSGEQNATMIRDLSAFNTWTRDTVWVGMNSKALSQAALLASAGNSPGGVSHSGSCVSNRWYSCDYRSYDSYFDWHDTISGGGIWNSVFASKTSGVIRFGLVSDFTFRANTVYAGGTKAIYFQVNPTTTLICGNVFASRCYPPAKCYADTDNVRDAALFIDKFGAVGSDSNYFAPTTLNHAAAASNFGMCWTLADWRSFTGNDMHSLASAYSGSIFMDSRWATLDLRPTAHSVLYNAAAPGGHYGALAKP